MENSISTYEKLRQEQKELDQKLQDIVVRKVREDWEKDKRSYAMHTPKPVFKRLGEESRKKY